MKTRKVSLAALVVSCFLGHSTPAFAHSMPVEFWVLTLMPACEKRIDGFAARSRKPYAKWRQKHSEVLSALAGIEKQGPDSSPDTVSDSLRAECDNLLSYMIDDIQPPDLRFATPQDTWNLFLQASRAGDKATIAECFAAAEREKYMSFINQLTPAQLAQTAESWDGFQLMEPIGDDLQEAWINKGERAGIAHFVKTSRGWQLSQLP